MKLVAQLRPSNGYLSLPTSHYFNCPAFLPTSLSLLNRRRRHSPCVTPLVRSRRLSPYCGVARPERYNTSDWAKALSTLPRSIVLRRIRGHLVANAVASSVILLLYELMLRYIPDVVHQINLTPLPHTFMATAMSLLLVLRSNAAYVSYSH